MLINIMALMALSVCNRVEGSGKWLPQVRHMQTPQNNPKQLLLKFLPGMYFTANVRVVPAEGEK